MQPIYGAIEGGGTKFVCLVGAGPEDIRAETRFPTTTPAETLGQAVAFFQHQEGVFGKLAAIGLACFGPLNPNPAGPAPMWLNRSKRHLACRSASIPMSTAPRWQKDVGALLKAAIRCSTSPLARELAAGRWSMDSSCTG
jgi:hypothetical protein